MPVAQSLTTTLHLRCERARKKTRSLRWRIRVTRAAVGGISGASGTPYMHAIKVFQFLIWRIADRVSLCALSLSLSLARQLKRRAEFDIVPLLLRDVAINTRPLRRPDPFLMQLCLNPLSSRVFSIDLSNRYLHHLRENQSQ